MQNTKFALQNLLFLSDLKMHVFACKGKPLQLMFIIPFSSSL